MCVCACAVGTKSTDRVTACGAGALQARCEGCDHVLPLVLVEMAVVLGQGCRQAEAQQQQQQQGGEAGQLGGREDFFSGFSGVDLSRSGPVSGWARVLSFSWNGGCGTVLIDGN